MLLLEPFWVYASVAFLVCCGRRHFTGSGNIWANPHFSVILILISGIFAPVENWVMLRHTDWETTFLIRSAHDSSVVAFASCLHVVCAVTAYWISMFLLQRHGVECVMKSATWAFTIFFTSQGLFYDCLMYSGTFDEYHAGVKKSFWSFFCTRRFLDAYVIFCLVYGPPFYCLSIYWNSGFSRQEKMRFIRGLTREAVIHGIIILIAYIFLLDIGAMPAHFDAWRLVPTLLMHVIFHAAIIMPLMLCTTSEIKKEDRVSPVEETQHEKDEHNSNTADIGLKNGRKICHTPEAVNGY